ncbi:lipid-binding protein [Flavobacterium cellulosilyticum]|uniref:Lipid-binding hydrolase n=1 Tax=Flavobacterium cellulosilyticum TaxID=2541731 RepID=A0A4V2YZ96_9FLAO|nr:lipid-binding protein [Flavobacterium cellulosilyticum]TDD96267.1 hypothetical protein E0F76_12285 [Flavobacterium cellulosilyticum]
MKLIKNNIIKILFGILILTSFSSCDEGGNPTIGGTTTKDFSGDWFITITDATGKVQVANALHYTYNTAANDNTMWIDDAKHGWYLKCKITVNLADGTFTATAQPNTIDSGTVTITEGKIEKGAGKSKAGHVVDKISFKAVFSYDAGTKLTFVGHKRTGFLEDEY